MPETPHGPIPRAIAWALARRPVRAFLLYSEHRGPQLADSVTYRALFSIFAAVLLGFSIAALWLAGNPDAWNALIRAVDSTIPGLVGADGLIDPKDITAPAALSIAGVISAVGLVGAAIGAIGSLRSALRTIADLPHDDTPPVLTILRNLLLAVIIGGGLVAAAVASLLATAGLGLVRGWLGLPESGAVEVVAWALSALVVFALDTVIVAAAFAILSGVKVRAGLLWRGALLGGAGLTVLQQLSGLFVGGASSNPLLASFGALIALLLWVNLSSQVILLSAAWTVTAREEEEDRVHARHGAQTFIQRRVRRAEHAVRIATDELDAARTAEEAERTA